MYDKELQDLSNQLNIFEKAFDIIRLIDPMNHQVIELHDNKIANTDKDCFHLLGNNKVCDNCITMRAYHDNKTYIKVEHSNHGIYIVTAIPIELDGRRVVIELLKDATDSFIINVNDNGQNTKLKALVDSMNNIAMRDSLTELYNRRFIHDKLPMELINANLGNYRIAIIMADIDFFKNVNDTYGHLVGDDTLKHFAGLLTQCIKRDTDWVARYGGEEFIICLPGASLRVATEVAESMRKLIEETLVESGEYQFHITASFGVSSIIPSIDCTIDELIDSSDKKLYQAKNNGRNRVEA